MLNVMETCVWRDRIYHLRFYFGEFSLGAIEFSAKVLDDIYFAWLPEDWGRRPLPLDMLRRDTDVLYLPSVPVGKRLPRLSLAEGTLRYVPAQYTRYYVEVHGAFSDYLQNFPSKKRRELLRELRRFEKDNGGTITWREFRSPQEVAEFYGLAREISQKTYQERLLKKGLPSNPEYLQALETLACADQVRGYILYCAGVPAVFHLCTIHGATMAGEYIGYDPQFRKYSPGSIEQYLLIEKLFKENQFQKFDFGEGESAYKEFFATGGVLCADIFYYRRTVRNLLLLALHSTLSGLSSVAANLLGHLRLKNRLKSFLRFRVYSKA